MNNAPITSSITIVDVLHADVGNILVSPRLQPHLFRRVISRINPRMSICLEGINVEPKGLGPDDQRYEEVITHCWPDFAEQTPPTVFRGFDPRCRVSIRQYSAVMREVDALLRVLDQVIVLTDIPTTVTEALEWVRIGHCAFEIVTRVNSSVKDLADSVYRLEKVLIKNYGNLAQQCAVRSDEVYLILGLMHAIGLHLKYGWPMMWLSSEDPWVTPENVYRSGMNFSFFLDAIRKS